MPMPAPSVVVATLTAHTYINDKRTDFNTYGQPGPKPVGNMLTRLKASFLEGEHASKCLCFKHLKVVAHCERLFLGLNLSFGT
jgi:hypothetical protein